MRTLLLLVLLCSAPALANKVRVRGHVTKSGKYVPPHVRTSPDSRKANNWSTKGNFNPYTGKKGKR